MRISDWSSDVCSSDLERRIVELEAQIFRAGLARRLGPGRPELDARCADPVVGRLLVVALAGADTRLDAKRQGADFAGVDAVRSEEHTSELQSLMRISYAVFCLKKKKQNVSMPLPHTND